MKQAGELDNFTAPTLIQEAVGVENTTVLFGEAFWSAKSLFFRQQTREELSDRAGDYLSSQLFFSFVISASLYVLFERDLFGQNLFSLSFHG